MDKATLIAQSYQFTPTAEQFTFCSEMASFLSHQLDGQCFILRGYAGTGKTTSVAALVKALPKFTLRAVLLAPTGRAAKVMSNYTGRKALTIHKKIYRKKTAVATDMSFQLAPNLAEHTLFIIDEASMIADEWNTQTGSSFLKDLMEFVYNGKNCAVVFVGDTAQLPPVGSLDSPALNKEYIASNFGMRVTAVELKEVVRQEKKSGILANATMLRKLINDDSETEKVELPKFITKNYKDIFRMTGVKLVEGLEYAYNKFGIENSLVVCRSNKSANVYNQQIRARLLYREEELTGGDQIMVVRNNYFWLPENESAAFIANGDMARIRRVRGIEERYGFRFCEVQLEFLDFPEAGEVTCKVILDTLTAETPNLSYEQSNKLFEGLNLDYDHISNKRDRLNKIKEDPYYNALQIKFAYAVTCHKAQGGQWDAVFVDQGYLTEEMIDMDFLRWLYTGVTRAKKELFLVNFAQNLFSSPAEEQF
ncbi:ATP-dependent DNA helicase [Pedobacter panaciterrae]|jgi:ATP-dependent exoDNAse (exonuclease V), alpha subunit - helicase superfamily I member|uniref:AAA family ATPase n=1 Tax=Pedobacter panaciterrae TaxID=363849 RepID=A0ABU8NLV6_9SPHI|nr:AAA family ATPase [Pedobacter panaciterrae]NQX52751.1 AAA family ATPase [Pedobacter panaciterrae]